MVSASLPIEKFDRDFEPINPYVQNFVEINQILFSSYQGHTHRYIKEHFLLALKKRVCLLCSFIQLMFRA